MSETALTSLGTQLAYQAPGLLVALVALVLAVAFMRQAPTSSLLTLVGAGLLLATPVSVAVAQALLMDAGPEMRSQWMMVLGFGGNLLRSLGLGLWVTAIFIGRNQPHAADAQMVGLPEKPYPHPNPSQPYPPQQYPPPQYPPQQYPGPR